MRKMIHVSMASNEALQALAAETRQTFQDLIDEAIADLLKKHKRPVTLKDMLRESLTRRQAAADQAAATGVGGSPMGGVLDPQGPIGAAERLILINATVVMLAVIIPVIVLTLGFAWWFRAGNTKARYMPDWEYSGPVELVVWSIPALVVVFLGGMAWISWHDLDPPKPLASATARPIEIQVVSLDWSGCSSIPSRASRASTALPCRPARRCISASPRRAS